MGSTFRPFASSLKEPSLRVPIKFGGFLEPHLLPSVNHYGDKKSAAILVDATHIFPTPVQAGNSRGRSFAEPEQDHSGPVSRARAGLRPQMPGQGRGADLGHTERAQPAVRRPSNVVAAIKTCIRLLPSFTRYGAPTVLSKL